jgi:hypothetical protein
MRRGNFHLLRARTIERGRSIPHCLLRLVSLNFAFPEAETVKERIEEQG